MDEKKPLGSQIKEGVSVEELETFARKYTTEVFLILAIIIASISSIFDFFTGPGWSLSFAGIGSILSIAFPDATIKIQRKLFEFLSRQDKTVQITIGIARLVLALFLPFILFAEIGFLAGIGFHRYAKHVHISEKKSQVKAPSSDEEHL